MPILYEPDGRDAQQFAALLDGGSGGEVVTVATAADLTAMLTRNPAEMLAVLGPNVELADALAVAAQYRVSQPALGVILMRDRYDVGLLGEAIRAGVREVVNANDRAGILAACTRSLEVSRQMAPAGPRRPGAVDGAEFDARVVTVFAAKGGCGKTTLATNIAIALAAGGQRRVGLIDLDLAFGDVAVMLQLVPERSIADAVGQQLTETAVRALLTPYGPGLDTLLAPAGPADAERVTQGLVADVLRLARGMFDFLVIDTPPQFTEHVMTALDASHVHLLVTTPDIPALKNLRIVLDTFDLLDLPAASRLVVLNRADAKVGVTAADIERVIRVPISAHVPSSRDVPIAINRGVPVIVDNPQHPVSRAVREFASGRLSGPLLGDAPPRGLRSLLTPRSRRP